MHKAKEKQQTNCLKIEPQFSFFNSLDESMQFWSIRLLTASPVTAI